ncbi:TraB/GumN family protein [Dysgonomonas sp. 511]|uniref:TraB/GumN family protein n=1 Tax=Dysgonomonas sp. 511 TaxID=2302930 RepID=UPI0013D818BB|nr:TraB/GumN family protein [Dysgonomonas sp. 511]NDV78173.1 TraB/GumN family protein [Dysgonomonas sp. 511]
MRTLNFIWVAILIFLASVFSAVAQDTEQYTGTLLWKVSGNGLEKPSYILGTHHLVHVSFADKIAGLKDAMETTEQTVGELLMSDQTSMQAKMQQAAVMPAGESYDKLLSAEDYATLDRGLREMLTVGLDQLGRLKPGMLSMVYTITLYTKIYPEFNPMSHEAIDAYVQRIAKEKGKPVLGLETVEDQIYALFDAAPLKEYAEILACGVKTSDKVKEQMDKMSNYYTNGQLREMYDLTFDADDECQMSQKHQDALYKDRNDKWVEKLPAIMKDKSSLIAVGALHLVGKDGLLVQLAQQGYTIEPVK